MGVVKKKTGDLAEGEDIESLIVALDTVADVGAEGVTKGKGNVWFILAESEERTCIAVVGMNDVGTCGEFVVADSRDGTVPAGRTDNT